MMLGDTISEALSKVGVTKERVSLWLGKPCGCEERQEKLNLLGRWAHRILTKSTDRAKQYLDTIMGDINADNK